MVSPIHSTEYIRQSTPKMRIPIVKFFLAAVLLGHIRRGGKYQRFAVAVELTIPSFRILDDEAIMEF